MVNVLRFNVWSKDGSYESRTIDVKKLYFGRHCDRNIEAVRSKLDVQRAEGYAVHENPNICRKSRYLLTNENVIEVQGPQTSGEVEIVAVVNEGEVLVSAGSDHNDRTLETLWTNATGKVYDTAKSKQMAPAVVAKDAWRYSDIKEHWEKLNLRSYIAISDEWIPYQDFTLAELVNLEYHFSSHPELREDGVVLFGGTMSPLPTVPPNIYQYQASIKGLMFPTAFRFEALDLVLKRRIFHSYSIISVEELESLSL